MVIGYSGVKNSAIHKTAGKNVSNDAPRAVKNLKFIDNLNSLPVSEREDFTSRFNIQTAYSILNKNTYSINLEFENVKSDNYMIKADNEAQCFDIYDGNGNRLGAFHYIDINIKKDSSTGTEVLLSSHGTMSYDVIPFNQELKESLATAIGVDKLDAQELSGFSIKMHENTGIEYIVREGEEGRGGRTLIQNEEDEKKFNALIKEYMTKYPNLIKNENIAAIYADLEIRGLAKHTPNGIISIGYDAISYSDNVDDKKNWSIIFNDKNNSYHTLMEMINSKQNLLEMEKFTSWIRTLNKTNGYDRVWSDDEEKQGYLNN